MCITDGLRARNIGSSEWKPSIMTDKQLQKEDEQGTL